MEYDKESIVVKIKTAMEETYNITEEISYDTAFHMTDWLEDMLDLHKFYMSPESYTSKQTTDLLMKFLLHVPNHLVAAHKLYTNEPVSDIFGIGALE